MPTRIRSTAANSLQIRARAALAVALGALVLITPAAAQCHYTYTPIPRPPGWLASPARSINNHGAVAGRLEGFGDNYLVYTWSPQTGTVVLPRPPGIISMESAYINDHGHIAGAMTSSSAWYGYVWDGVDYAVIELPSWAGIIEVNGINNDGQVVGTLWNPIGPHHAFRWQNGTLTVLGSFISPFGSTGSDISEGGRVIGAAHREYQPPYYESRAYSLESSTLTWFPDQDSAEGSRAKDLSNSGFVAGQLHAAEDDPGPRVVGSIWHPDGEQSILAPPDGTPILRVEGINNAGRAAGYLYRSDLAWNDIMFVWQNGIRTDPRPLVVPPLAWRLRLAYDINDSGQIVVLTDEGPAVLTPHWLPGDLTGDCHVTLDDLALLLANFGSPPETFPRGDVDIDGDVDLTDLAILLAHWGT